MKKRIDIDAEVATVLDRLKARMRGEMAAYPPLAVAWDRVKNGDLIYAYHALVEVYGQEAVKAFSEE